MGQDFHPVPEACQYSANVVSVVIEFRRSFFRSLEAHGGGDETRESVIKDQDRGPGWAARQSRLLQGRSRVA